MTSTTTAPEAEYWLQTGWMEEPGAEFGIRKPVTIDRKTNLYEHRAYWCVRRAQDIFFSLLALVVLSPKAAGAQPLEPSMRGVTFASPATVGAEVCRLLAVPCAGGRQE